LLLCLWCVYVNSTNGIHHYSSMELLDGKKVSAEVLTEIAQEVALLKKQGKRAPHLVAVLVGTDGASETYVNSKVKHCGIVGFESTLLRYNEDISEKELLEVVERLNQDPNIDGFIVQLPLPKHIDEKKITLAIAPEKDVDGFHPSNVGRLTLGLPTYVSATPLGIVEMLKKYNIPTEGKNCVVVGRSNIVGTPIAILMTKNTNPGNATVTICHSKTQNLKEICAAADILIVAMGKPEFIKADMVKSGAVVVDVGIHRIADDSKKSGFRLVGDVKFDEVAPKASFITPVPGGVGLMTICSLLLNTLKSAKKEIYS
jgi:methylenetetrahydrofolate dehydrogenase (NADP+) / methenyltetrahydrofolate cyclohydrolase